MINIKYILAKVIERMMIPAIYNSTIDRTSRIGARSVMANSTLGKYSYCGNDSSINDTDIGHFCSIANKVLIGAGDHPINNVSTSPAFYGSSRNGVKRKLYHGKQPLPPRTTVGNDVWIGYGALIKSGVNIGDGAIIAMGSIVTKDVAPYAIVAGNPAKLIKHRFENQLIFDMLSSEWWNLEGDILCELGEYINEPSIFLEKLNNIKHNTRTK
ncbi:MAG: CatB-related O-acetyltransferase [Rikenellaceae bacterium]